MDKFLKKKPVDEGNSKHIVVSNSKTTKSSNSIGSSSNSSSSSSSSSSTSSSSGSLINQLRHASSTTASKSDAWEPYLQSNNSAAFSSSASILSKTNTYSLSDIAGANREAAYKKQASNTGWKMVNGVKIYSTFRNGGKVQGEGAEGFKLAMGDKGKSGKKEKNKVTENIQSKSKDATEKPMTKKRKVQELQSNENDCNEKPGKQSMVSIHQQHQPPPFNSTNDDLYGFSFD